MLSASLAHTKLSILSGYTPTTVNIFLGVDLIKYGIRGTLAYLPSNEQLRSLSNLEGLVAAGIPPGQHPKIG